MKESDMNDKINYWVKKDHTLELWVYKMSVICSVIRIIAAIIVLAIVLIKRKRKEWFIVLTPVLLITSDICNIVAYTYVLTTKHSEYPNPE